MSNNEPRIPRVSLAVSFHGDEDTVSLLAAGDEGSRAVLLFVQILLLAKQMKNEGRFKGKIERYAPMLFLTPSRARRLFDTLGDTCKANGNAPWVVETGEGFEVRSWKKWNAWGGSREGAGKPRANQVAKLDYIKSGVKCCASGIDSDTGTERKTKEPPLPPCGGNENLAGILREWVEYKREKGQRYKPKGLLALEKQLVTWGEERARAAVDFSMANGYSGVFEPNSQSAPKSAVPATAHSAFVFTPREQQETA